MNNNIKENDNFRQLIKTQEEYIKLISDELTDVVGIASVHGWKSNRYEQGKLLREKIERLKENYDYRK